jgi:hypothetical protein
MQYKLTCQHKKLKKSKKTRSRNDEDDTDDNEAVMNSGNDNHGDNPDDYDSDAVQEVDHDAMRLARTKRFGLTSNTTSDAGASTNRGQVKQGVKARYELESSLEVEEPVAASASRSVPLHLARTVHCEKQAVRRHEPFAVRGGLVSLLQCRMQNVQVLAVPGVAR